MYRNLPRRPVLVAIVVAVASLSLALPAAASLVSGDSARVAFTGGDGVNVRFGPGVSNGVIATLPEGHEVSIFDGPVTGDDGWPWYGVWAMTVYGDVEGWVRSDFLTGEDDFFAESAGGAGVPDALDDSDSAASGVPAMVSTNNGPLNLRSSPSLWAVAVSAIPDGAYVEVLDTMVYDDTGTAWSLVRYGGVVGYVASAYLYSGLAVPTDATVPVAATASEVSAGNHAVVAWTGGAGVNVRSGPGVDSGIVTALFDDTPVYVIDGPAYDAAGDGWYQVEAAGTYGWVIGHYLAPAYGRSVASWSGTGAAILDLAYAYMGVPYVWGGTDPSGFDCSGFTWFVLSNIVGDWYPRPMEDQIETGIWVASTDLQPGDVIYFQNTYQWGVSHVGFYVGNGQFISASGEHFGVGVSSLYDPYWSTRYLTARRVN